ncbi:MAG: PcfJ domain-containing protein, partial [Clostridiales bacterium]|nr:PcfJ domain-containing protein [Clostridiales bacterium]
CLMRVLLKAEPCVYTADNVKKTFKYLRNQWAKTNNHVARDYVDYLADCRKLGLDVDSKDIRYPTDLAQAHIRTTALVQLEANKEKNARIRDVYERFRALCEFSDGEYCIVMPSSCEEIIYEGKVQSHCVGGYAERMAKGEDIILFLRKANKPNTPFYTIEIRPIMKKLDIVQCRGRKNADKSDEVDKFLKKYEAWFNRRKCDVVVSTRRKYYKAVRKTADGKYISDWDNKTEYRIGEIIESRMDGNPDLTAVQGIHIASLEFAKNYCAGWVDAAILEIEVDMRDVVIPNAKDQLRTKRGKVLREVPLSEYDDCGKRYCSRCAG